LGYGEKNYDERQRPMLNRNFLLIAKLSWGLFYPKLKHDG